MPRLSKDELTGVEIRETTEEGGRIPFFLLGDDYGIAVDQLSYVLVKKKESMRYIRDEDGSISHGETYYRWTDIGYVGTFRAALEFFYTTKVRDEFSKIKKAKSYKELMEMESKVMEIIREATQNEVNCKEAFSIGDAADLKRKLEKELAEISAMKDKVQEETDGLLSLIKEKRSLVLKGTEPKKHRIKIEK